MIGNLLAEMTSRRGLMRSMAGAGLAVPLAAGAGSSSVAAQGFSGNYHGHPIVGVWYGGGPTFEYQIFHADGNFQFYNPWIAAYAGQGDAQLAVLGYGVWAPRGDRTFDGSFKIAWVDSNVTSLASFRARGEVSESGDHYIGWYKSTLVDQSGNLIFRADGGPDTMTRLQLEPFDDDQASPEATPES